MAARLNTLATFAVAAALSLGSSALAADYRFGARVGVVASVTLAEPREAGLLRLEGEEGRVVQLALAGAAGRAATRGLGPVLLGPDGSLEIDLGAQLAREPGAGEPPTYTISITYE